MIPVWIDIEHTKHGKRGHHPESPLRLGPMMDALKGLPITLHHTILWGYVLDTLYKGFVDTRETDD